MITRERIYGKEAAGLLRAVTMYGALYETQLCRLYPGRESVVRNLLKHLTRQKRIEYVPSDNLYTTVPSNSIEIDSGMIAAFWVMLDFIDKVEFHSASDFPVKISFIASENHYEIIHVSVGNEFLVSHAMSLCDGAALSHGTEPGAILPRRIILVDDVRQIEKLNISHSCGYCTADKDGHIIYYKRE